MENLEKRIAKLESENNLIKYILKEALKSSLDNAGRPLFIRDDIKELLETNFAIEIK